MIQLATPSQTFLIDALEVSDFSVLAEILASKTPLKIIHNASFEREVLGRHNLEIHGVIDTMVVSRERHPHAQGGHSLQAVAARELNLMLDKTQQTSDWAQRPLTLAQLEYAALDAEVLFALAGI